jgi:hypothetical protein
LSTGCLAQAGELSVPYVQKNICPFECCQYGKWTAKTALPVYKKEGDTSTVAFTIKHGEQITASRGNIHIVELGIVAIQKSFNIFKKSTKAYLLSYSGEGEYDLWYEGKVYNTSDSDEFWTNAVVSKTPKLIWWVLIKDKAGKQGWLMLRNISQSGFQTKEKIDGLDSCS